MPIGPLETFVFPSVITQTTTEATGVSAAGNARFPAIIGVGFEEIRISDFEMIRGSSAVADNIILDEAVTGEVDDPADLTSPGWLGGPQGQVNKFRVKNFPLVTGTGTGTVATLPRQVIVTVNGDAVAVNAINGLLGEVTLVDIPLDTDEVNVNYYFKRRDTYIENEDLSFQADGSTVNFKVRSSRICTGNNGGQSATDADIGGVVNILYKDSVSGTEYTKTVPIIQVKVNSVITTVTALDGAHGIFTLATPPASGAKVLISYFTNIWQDTFDILPAAQVNRIVKVGLSADTSDYSIGQDVILAGANELHWGTSHEETTGIYTEGSTPLISNVLVSLTDTMVFGRITTPSLTDNSGNNGPGNKIFTLPSTPVDGAGTGTPTEDPALITAYAGDSWANAYSSGEVVVDSISGNVITLEDSPQTGNNVYVTYYENIIVDDTWTITDELPGVEGVGRYSVVSKFNGIALDVTQASGGTVSPVYPSKAVLQVAPLTSSVEIVTITFAGGVGVNAGEFTVTSNGKTGTGPSNTGYQGSTYIDSVTGFRVTFENMGAFNPTAGQYVIYNIGNPSELPQTQTWFYTKSEYTEAIPGINLTIDSTDGGNIENPGDTVILQTFNKSGNEPAVGDSYYVSFDKTKTDYTVKSYNNMRDVYKDFGPLDITNKVVVGANLAFLNGASSVALKQIQRATGSPDASKQAYYDGIDAFDEPMPDGTRPSLIQPMSTDPDVEAYLSNSNAIQSSVKYHNERTSVVGFAFGTTPESAIQQCKALASEKITPVYPEAAVISIPDAFGNDVQYLVDGSFLAVAVAGRDVSPVSDIATSLTNQTIVGFDRLYRRLDDVTAALVANSGCTVLEDVTPQIKIRMYLTSDLSNSLTRDPRIVEVKHFIQQGIRQNLDQYIGQKNLPSIMPQIANTVKTYFQSLKNNQIIVDYKGVRVTQNTTDPSTLDVEVFYSPVYPLNWIIVTLNLRQSL
jgi:hypothetical protein